MDRIKPSTPRNEDHASVSVCIHRSIRYLSSLDCFVKGHHNHVTFNNKRVIVRVQNGSSDDDRCEKLVCDFLIQYKNYIKQTLQQTQTLCGSTPNRDEARPTSIGTSFDVHHNNRPGNLQFYIEKCLENESTISSLQAENKRLQHSPKTYQTRHERPDARPVLKSELTETCTVQYHRTLTQRISELEERMRIREMENDKLTLDSIATDLRNNLRRVENKAQQAGRYQQERDTSLKELWTLRQKVNEFETEIVDCLQKHRFEPPRKPLYDSQSYLVDFKAMTDVLQNVIQTANDYYCMVDENEEYKRRTEELQSKIKRGTGTGQHLQVSMSMIQEETHRANCIQNEKEAVEQILEQTKSSLALEKHRANRLERSNQSILMQLDEAMKKVQTVEQRLNKSNSLTERRLLNENEDMKRRLQEAEDDFQGQKSRINRDLQLLQSTMRKQELTQHELEKTRECCRLLQSQLDQANSDLSKQTHTTASLEQSLQQAEDEYRNERRQMHEELQMLKKYISIQKATQQGYTVAKQSSKELHCQLEQAYSDLTESKQHLTHLKHKHQSLESHVEDLKETLNETKKQNALEKSFHREQLAKVETELTRVNNKNTDTIDQQVYIRETTRADDLERDNQSLHVQLDGAMNKLQTVEQSSSQSASVIERLLNENKNLKRRLREAEDDVERQKSRIERELQSNVTKHELAQQELEKARNCCRSMQSQLEQANSDLARGEQDIASLEQRLQQDEDNYRKEKSIFNKELEISKSNMNKHKATQQQYEQAKQSCKELRHQLEQSRSELTESKQIISHLNHKQQSLESNVERLKERLNETKKQSSLDKEQLNQVQTELKSAVETQTDYQKIKKRYVELQKQLTQVNNKNTELQNMIDQQLHRRETKRANDLETDNRSLQQQLDDAINKLQRVEQSSSRNAGVTERLMNENINLKQRLQEAEDDFQRQISRQNSELQLLKTDASKNELARQELEKAIESGGQLQHRLEQANFDSSRKTEDLERSLQQTQDDFKKEKNQLLRELQILKTNTNKQDVTQQEFKRAEQRCSELQCQLEQTTSDLSRSAQGSSHLKHRNKTLQTKIEDLKERINDAHKQNTAEQSLLKQSRDKVQTQLNNTMEKLKECEEIRIRYEAVLKQLAQVKTKNTELRNVIDQQAKEIDSFSMNLVKKKSIAEYLQQQLEFKENELKVAKDRQTRIERDKKHFPQDKQQIHILEKRNAELVDRLAAEMNSKISANESSLENISIKARPMNVAEEYSLLQSNSWLDAKSALDEMDPDDKWEAEKVKLLFVVLQVSEQQAVLFYDTIMMELVSVLKDPIPSLVGHGAGPGKASGNSHTSHPRPQPLPQNLTTAVGDYFRISVEGITLDYLTQSIVSIIRSQWRGITHMPDITELLQINDVTQYVKDCATLGWKMVIQRPRMCFEASRVGYAWRDDGYAELMWGSNPKAPGAKIQYYKSPRLLHGDKPMVKASVFVHNKINL